MTEEKLREFNKSTDGLAHDLPDQQSLDQWIGLAFLNFMKFNKHFADLTRQATRIADAMGNTVAVVEPPGIDANIRFEILAKAFFYDTKMMAPGKSIAAAANPPYTEEDRSKAWDKWLKENDVPPPPDDALVEAVKKAVADLNNVTGSSDDYTQAALGVADDLKDALDAHKKAGE